MAPIGKPRGRPRKLADKASSTTGYRRSSTRRAQVPIDIDDDSSDLLSVSMIGTYSAPKTTGERDSLSSASDHNNESTGYSTPATSAFATPAPQLSEKPSIVRRGRPRMTTMPTSNSTPAISAVARAAALRNSEYSLNTGNNKRKRIIESSEDELDADDDNSADAQLARVLQKQEDEAAAGIVVSKPARRPRKAQKILPKFDFVATDDDDDDDDGADSDSAFAPVTYQRPKVELDAKGSNGVSFSSKRGSRIILDSDESDNFTDEDDSEDDKPIKTSTPRSRSKQAAQSYSRKAKAQTVSTRRGKMLPPQRPSVNSRSAPSPSSVANPVAGLRRQDTSTSLSSIPDSLANESEFDSDLSELSLNSSDSDIEDVPTGLSGGRLARPRSSMTSARRRVNTLESRHDRRGKQERARLEAHHPELRTMWQDLENLPKILNTKIEQPKNINRELKPFQLEGVAWMKGMEETEWGGGLLGDEMGMGKTIQAVSLIMSDWPAKQPSLVLIPPVALMQWQQEISDYTDGTLKTFVYHGTNLKTKGITAKELMKYNVILMSYNSLESMYRKQEKGFKRKAGLHKEKSVIHQIHFHRVILDEAHNIKQRTTGSAKACFALKADHKWCLSGTPLQNRIGEFFSLVRFLDIRPFACYFCKQCDCSELNWDMNADNRCTGCNHSGMQHVSVFNQELLNPIQKFGNSGPGKEAFRKLRILTDRFMLRRVKRDHSSAMELPAKEIYVDRQFFGEEENDFAGSIMNSGTRKFETYVAQGVLLNNYANIFGLIMQMRQVADHPDLILKKNGEGGQNILVCCICDETAEEAIRSVCRHEFCRECAKNYLHASDSPDCPTCHIPLAIDLEQPDIEQDEQLVKKSSIINRIKMENWTSSSKIETLVHDLHELRSKNMSSKSIIFSQFTTMLQLVEWRLRRAGITTVMLDGSMTPAQRQASINHFMTNVNVECFLVSLKAGGVALNLTEASKVFIVDPWWNPAAEWQSADRCHRIGQGRPCSITRLCIEDSVESRMVLLQEKKANMINSTINADESAMESLTPEDMQFLFRGT